MPSSVTTKEGKREMVQLVACRLKGHKIVGRVRGFISPSSYYYCETCKSIGLRERIIFKTDLHYKPSNLPIKLHGRGADMIITDEFLGVAE